MQLHDRSLYCFIKVCVHYIFASLFCRSKGKHLWNKGKWFLVGVQGLTYLFEVPLWKFIHSQCHVGWVKIKTYTPTHFPSLKNNILFTITENKFIVWNYRFAGSTCIYLFQFSNINSRLTYKLCLDLTMDTSDVILVSLLLTLNIFYTLLCCILCWLWTLLS